MFPLPLLTIDAIKLYIYSPFRALSSTKGHKFNSSQEKPSKAVRLQPSESVNHQDAERK